MIISLDDNKIDVVFKEEFDSNKEKLTQFIENVLLNVKEYKNFNYNFDESNLEAFTASSIENIPDWLDEKEDEIWK